MSTGTNICGCILVVWHAGFEAVFMWSGCLHACDHRARCHGYWPIHLHGQACLLVCVYECSLQTLCSMRQGMYASLRCMGMYGYPYK